MKIKTNSQTIEINANSSKCYAGGERVFTDVKIRIDNKSFELDTFELSYPLIDDKTGEVHPETFFRNPEQHELLHYQLDELMRHGLLKEDPKIAYGVKRMIEEEIHEIVGQNVTERYGLTGKRINVHEPIQRIGLRMTLKEEPAGENLNWGWQLKRVNHEIGNNKDLYNEVYSEPTVNR